MAPVDGGTGGRTTARTWPTAALLALLLVGALVVIWGWEGGSTARPDDVASPTTRPTTTVVSQSPDEVEATTHEPLGTPVPTPRPTSAPAPTTATHTPDAPAEALTQHGPVHVAVTRATDVLVDAPVALTQLNERDELNPPAGVVGWYGPPDWATVPGELSAYPGVLAGHTTYGGARDVFYRLGEVRAGDTVTISYADGQEAVFHVDADAVSVPKNDVTEKADAEYSWVWHLPEPGRKVSLFSCDLAQGLDLTGHSVNNWVVQATRVD